MTAPPINLPRSTKRKTAGLLAICTVGAILAFVAAALFHPNCQDPATKQHILASLRWLPWLFCGVAIGLIRPDRWLSLALLFFVMAYPAASYAWMKVAFVGWSDWKHYWLVLSSPLPLLVLLCLTISGSVSGSLFRDERTRKHAVVIVLGTFLGFGVYLAAIDLSHAPA